MRCLKVLGTAVVTVCLACGPLRAAFIDDHVKPMLPTKWSQPVDVDNGHDVYSFWQGGNDFPTTVVADDWKCPDGLPITDFHWWGSYIQGSPGGLTRQGGVL